MHRVFALLTVAPVAVWVLAIAGTLVLGGLAGCRIDEGAAHPCMVAGHDLAQTAYTLGMLAAWGPLLFVPVCVAIALVWGAATLLRAALRRWRAR